jgi:hypothetical protein
MLPDFERTDRIGEVWGNPKTRIFAELLSIARRIGRFERCSSECCGNGR